MCERRLVATISVGSDPGPALYDSGNGYVYVANYNSSSVSVIRGTSEVATLPVGSLPSSGTYDSRTGYVYVPNSGSNNVSVIDGTTVLGAVPVGGAPIFAAYDGSDGYVYVANVNSTVVFCIPCTNYGSVSVISGMSVIATVTVGYFPSWLTYDSENGYVYVTNGGSNNVSVISGTSLVGTILVGSGWTEPTGATYNADSGYLYISLTNFTNNIVGGGNVSIVNGTSIVATIPAGYGAFAGAYDNRTGGVYVPNSASDNVSVIIGTKLVATLGVGSQPGALVYDDSNGYVYVPSYGSNNVSVIGAAPTGEYSVAFTETGLPAGTDWAIRFAGPIAPTLVLWESESSTNTSIVFGGLVNGTYGFQNASAPGYSASPPYGLLTVNGTSAAQLIAFSPTNVTQYSVTFTESGLPVGYLWSVTLNGTTETSNATTNVSSITFAEPNGTYSFTVGSGNCGPIFCFLYDPTPSRGSLVVNGTAESTAIAYSVPYPISFTESGLPSGTDWSATLNGTTESSTTPTISFTVPNGTYAYSLASSNPLREPYPSAGNVTVSGAAASVNVGFFAIYPVTVTEQGLPAGSLWYVSVSAVATEPTPALSYAGTGQTISFSLLNGSYTYALSATNSSWVSSPGFGHFAIFGTAPAPLLTVFSATYLVTFTESGLGSGISWSVTLNGTTVRGYSASLSFRETNGSYSFVIGSVAGYNVTPSAGNVGVVFGGPVNVAVTFTSTANSGGAASGIAWWVWAAIGIMAVMIVTAMVAVAMRRKPPTPPSKPVT